jgi:hypothetical protein
MSYKYEDMYPATPVRGYKSSSTVLGISKTSSGKSVLVFEACSSKGMLLYVVSLFELNHNESSLADGRFKNYSAPLRVNEVVSTLDMTRPSHHADDYQTLVTKQIEWIACETFNTPISWAFSVEATSSQFMANHYFFSDPDLAVHFKLYWS